MIYRRHLLSLITSILILGVTSITLAEGQWRITSRSQASGNQQAAKETGSENNYLEYVVQYQGDGSLIRFRDHQMPIQVYITTPLSVPGWTAKHNEQVRAAMREWTALAGDTVSFEETTSINKADIIVYWKYSIYHSTGDKEVWGRAFYGRVTDKLRGTIVHMATHNFDNNELISLKEVKGIAIHEFGHTLGLHGHSPDPDDIMHPTCETACQESRLSSRDLNTLRMLYNLDEAAENF